MTLNGKIFAERVYAFSIGAADESVENAIIKTLVESMGGLKDPEEVYRHLGEMANANEGCSFSTDSKTELSRALCKYVNYEELKESAETKGNCKNEQRCFYKDMILKILSRVLKDCDLKKSYERIGSLIP